MKDKTERWRLLFDYVENNIQANLSLDKIASKFYFSKFHIQRQFKGYFGISPFTLVKLIRLKRSAYQLVFRKQLKVIDIAFEAGFESSESFSRAFKNEFNLSPREFRKTPFDGSLDVSFNQLNKLRKKSMETKFQISDVEIVEFNKTKIAVLEHKGSPALLAKSIQKFIAWRKKNKLPPSKYKTFNLIYDDPRVTLPDDYRFDLACSIDSEIKKNGDGVINKTIPQGRCALLRVIGPDFRLGTAVEYLYSQWLEQSGEELRDFPLFFHSVSFFPDVTENEMITDIYLPLK